MGQTEDYLNHEARLAALEGPDPPERNSELVFYIVQMILGFGLVVLGHITANNWLMLIGAIPTAGSPIAYGMGRITLKKEAISNGRTD